MEGSYFSFKDLACRAAIAFDFLRTKGSFTPETSTAIEDLASFMDMSEDPEQIDPCTTLVFLEAMKDVFPYAKKYTVVQELARGVTDAQSRLRKCHAERTYDGELAKFCLALSKAASRADMHDLDYRVKESSPIFR